MRRIWVEHPGWITACSTRCFAASMRSTSRLYDSLCPDWYWSREYIQRSYELPQWRIFGWYGQAIHTNFPPLMWVSNDPLTTCFSICLLSFCPQSKLPKVPLLHPLVILPGPRSITLQILSYICSLRLLKTIETRKRSLVQVVLMHKNVTHDRC